MLIVIFFSIFELGKTFDYFCYNHRDRPEVTKESQIFDIEDCENHLIFMKYYSRMEGITVIKGRNNVIDILRDYEIQEVTPNIEQLDLSKNDIFQIERHSFRGLNRLKILNLAENKINILSPLVFRGLELLEVLNMSKNELQTLESQMFISNSHMKSIDLSTNKISRIQPDVFQNLIFLELLNLMNNQCVNKKFAFHDYQKSNVSTLVFGDSTCINHEYCEQYLKNNELIINTSNHCEREITQLSREIETLKSKESDLLSRFEWILIGLLILSLILNFILAYLAFVRRKSDLRRVDQIEIDEMPG